ncbi:methylated DNA-protein cysteine methyltransferase [Methanobrevibacter sp. YE315]|uniref:MGMT family protein n=1 Tax=Methanobrevibacter sp. YE315 TaxID=1609968 RepID=UPI000764D5C8|nr:MGMT family protein [Methanobrevibacter sp. YE315]AMD17319.1 methylated DNA-protein cysteine methyltransferase [Methanobrevibacter sp. YE315]
MARKSFNEKLQDSKDMPKIVVIDDEKSIERYGGKNMLIAPPIEYSQLMSKIPEGKVITAVQIREFLADKYKSDFTCPMTAGIFISLSAQASDERDTGKIPFWRTLKTDGELNPKYPGGIEFQKEKLIGEGHEIITKGRKNIRYFVKDFENDLYDLKQIR